MTVEEILCFDWSSIEGFDGDSLIDFGNVDETSYSENDIERNAFLRNDNLDLVGSLFSYGGHVRLRTLNGTHLRIRDIYPDKLKIIIQFPRYLEDKTLNEGFVGEEKWLNQEPIELSYKADYSGIIDKVNYALQKAKEGVSTRLILPQFIRIRT